MAPNLFSYATHELSQDAFICWLLAWSQKKYQVEDPLLYQAGRRFLAALLAKHGVALPEDCPIRIEKQYHSMDVVVFVGTHAILLIEDKTFTPEHDGQLMRYKAYLEANKPDPECRVLPIYYKTGDQCDYSHVTGAGYQLFLRSDILSCLKGGAVPQNPIFQDYLAHICGIESRVEAFRSLPPKDWGGPWADAWIGLYSYLRRKIADFRWEGVSNPNGGFLCGYWHHRESHGQSVNLQIEAGPLVIKTCVPDKALRSEAREALTAAALAASDSLGLLPFRRPKYPRSGNFMTAARLEPESWLATGPDGLLDLAKTLKNLQSAASILDKVAAG